MQQYCLVCERHSASGNLYCEQSYCPGELSPWVFETGERIGDIEIVRLVTVLRSAAVYAALRQGEQVYIKIAHQGSHNKERLKREAELLAVAQTQNVTAPFFPVLLPPTVPSSAKGQTYGKVVAAGTLLYYYVFQYMEAESLRYVLRKQPQLWINHVGWIGLGVAIALAYMHKRARFDFALCPEAVLVAFDKEPPNTPRILLVDLGVVSTGDQLPANWSPGFVDPVYAAPELVDDRSYEFKHQGTQIAPEPRTDVYGLGMLLYEMLIGAPPVTSLLRSDRDVLAAVQRGQRLAMDRVDDVKAVAELAQQATDVKPARRPSDPAAFGHQLQTQFGPIPEVKKRRTVSPRTLLVIAGALLAIAFLLAFSLSIVQFVS